LKVQSLDPSDSFICPLVSSSATYLN